MIIPESELAADWNAQADEYNQWNVLSTEEQLEWAQERAVAAYQASYCIQPDIAARADIPDLKHCDEQVTISRSEYEQLHQDLNTSLDMLAAWCVAVELKGSNWDDWDDYYKNAAYRPGPMRERLDAALAKERARRSEYEQLLEDQEFLDDIMDT